MDIRKPLAVLIPMLAASLFLTEDATSESGGGSILSGNGYTPGRCEVEPPAELLALADWPLDDKDECLGGSNLATGGATLAEVVEARVRPVREILLTGLDEAPAQEEPAQHAGDDRGGGHSPHAAPPSSGHEGIAAGGGDDGPRQRTAFPTRTAPRPETGGLLARAAVADAELDGLRGGFQTPDGLNVSFGIERVVYVNGVLQSTTALRVEDLGRLHGSGNPIAVLPPGETVALIQNGAGNTVAANVLNGSALGTIIQNSLDSQKVQTVTTINATVNSAQILQGMRMQQSLQEALNRATLMR